MALTKLYGAGDGAIKYSIVGDDSLYFSKSITSYQHIKDEYSIMTVVGTNLSPIIEKMSIGDVVYIAKFKDGSHIKITTDSNVVANGTWGNTGVTFYQRSVEIWYVNASGGSERWHSGDHILYGMKSGKRYDYPEFMIVALDYENKAGYMVSVERHIIGAADTSAEGCLRVRPYTSGISSKLFTIFSGAPIEYDPDPWSNGGYGDIGGGDGELDLTSDIIELPELPPSFTETGFIQMFAPSLTQINELSNYMWNGSFFDNFLKLFSNPMDIIIGLSMYPFPIPTGGQRLVHAGNILTTVNMSYPISQYATIDCGTIDVKHFYDAYIDYDPYTTCKIYLPYIGVQQLSMDDIMGKTLHVIYRVDLLTGVCGAYILCDDIILYTFTGECSAQIPISGQSFQSIVQSSINIATSTALGAHSTKNTTALENGARSAASSLAGNVMSMKPDVNHSGSLGSNVGMLAPQKPYLIFSVPRTCLPKGQNKYLGYPIFMTVKLSELKGYTEVENLWLNNMTCTEEEKKEIEDLLKGGVIL